MRRAGEDLFALLLGHATQNAESLALPEELFLIEAVEDLLLGFVADGAGVVEDEAGFRFRVNLAIALLKKRADHLLGVVGIHLAAECLQIKCLFGRHRDPSIPWT